MTYRPLSPTLIALAAFAPAFAAEVSVESSVTNGSPITVVASPEQPGDYTATSATTANRTDTPLKDTPQSIQVLPRAVLDDQQSATLSEALTNVSGVRSQSVLNQNLDPANERLIRGFTAETYRDGMPLTYSAGDRESMANVERIEVLKGPSALMYASSLGAPIGGLVNLVQKKPQATPSYAAGITAGSYGYVSGDIDLNQPLTASGSVLSRITAEVGRSRSHIDVIETKRGSVDPTIAFTANTGTTLTLHGRWSQRLQQDYSGLPLAGTIVGAPYTIDRDLFPGNADVPRVDSRVLGGDATIEQRLSEHWVFTVPVQVSHSKYDQYGQYISSTPFFLAGTPPTPPVYELGSVYLMYDLHEVSVAPSIAGEFYVGATHNRVVFGGDYDRMTVAAVMTAASAPGTIDVTNPNPPPYATQDFPFYDTHSVFKTAGLYGQIESTIAERVTLVGGLRMAYAQIHDSDAYSGDKDQSHSRLLPRVGASVALTNWLSSFVGYGQGYRAIPYAQGIQDPKPEQSDQIEAGLKVADSELITASAAVFQLQRTNVPAPDPAGGLLQVQIGEQRSRGFETDIALTPGTHWSFLANYALTDAIITDNPVNEGNRIAAVPRHSGRLWARYEFGPELLDGFSLGSGITATGRREVDNANTAEVPGNATVDASAQYHWRNYNASLTAKNLFNAHYWEPNVYLENNVAPSNPLTLLAAIEARF
jgi:iron complex outermembrane receptor protein